MIRCNSETLLDFLGAYRRQIIRSGAEYPSVVIDDIFMSINHILNDNNYKVKNKKNYTYIKNKKGNYFRLYKKNNKIIYGTTNNKRHIKDVKRVLNELLN